ncbi:MAG: hypothetical protein ABI593_15765 [Betaproteobacteria bacterium]
MMSPPLNVHCGHCRPDIRIFTASKRRRLVLPPETPAVTEYCNAAQMWPAESLARRDALRVRTGNHSGATPE